MRKNLIVASVLVLVLLIATMIFQNDIAGEAFRGLERRVVSEINIDVKSTKTCDVQAWVENSGLEGEELTKATSKLCPDLLKKIRVTPLDGKLPGDVDMDGKVTPEDAELVINSMVHSTGLLKEQFSVADVDRSGFVDYKDVSSIINSFEELAEQDDQSTSEEDSEETEGIGEEEQIEFTPGDVNDDGIITQDDIEIIEDYILNDADLTPQEFLAADFDENNIVNTEDIIQIVQLLQVSGCMDEAACNYDPEATINEECHYPSYGYCDGECVLEFDCFDVCGGDAVVDECGVCAGDGTTCEFEVKVCFYDEGEDCDSDCDYCIPNDMCGNKGLKCHPDPQNDDYSTCVPGGPSSCAPRNYCVNVLGYDGYVSNSKECDEITHDKGNWATESSTNFENCGDSGFDEWVVSMNCFSTEPIIVGCTDETACNYDPDAVIDEGCLVEDCVGVCGGYAELDCAGDCNGDSVADMCGVCDDDPNNNCVQACDGVWGGTAERDMCDVCDDDPGNDCVQDCNDEWGGTAVVDECGVCDSDPNNHGFMDMCGVCDSDPSNDCVQACDGVWGGTAVVDECGVCGGTGDCASGEIILMNPTTSYQSFNQAAGGLGNVASNAWSLGIRSDSCWATRYCRDYCADTNSDCFESVVTDGIVLAEQDSVNTAYLHSCNEDSNAGVGNWMLWSGGPKITKLKCNLQIPTGSQVFGCTDPEMYGYDPNANVNDDSCEEFYYGCTDESAINYDPDANTNDGSCNYVQIPQNVQLDPQADSIDLNWEVPDALDGYEYEIKRRDPETEDYATTSELEYSDDGVTLTDTYCYSIKSKYGNLESEYTEEICGEKLQVFGCMDASASNYNPAANQEDEEGCEYATELTATVAYDDVLTATISVSGPSPSNNFVWDWKDGSTQQTSITLVEHVYLEINEYPVEISYTYNDIEYVIPVTVSKQELTRTVIDKIIEEQPILTEDNFIWEGDTVIGFVYDHGYGDPIELPEEIGKLNELKHIELLDMEYGEVPDFILQLENLESLNLRGSNLQNSDYLTLLPETLKELNLQSNELTSLSSGFNIDNFPALEKINLGSNDLTSFPAEFYTIQLKELNLAWNIQFTEFHASVSNFDLEVLKIGFTGIEDLSFVTDFENLKELHAESINTNYYSPGNELSETPSFTSLTFLEVLNLEGNDLDEFPDVDGLQILKEVYLSYNEIEFIPELTLISLEYLDVSNNDLEFLEGINGNNLKDVLLYSNNLITLPVISVSDKLDVRNNALTEIPNANCNVADLKIWNNKICFEEDGCNQDVSTGQDCARYTGCKGTSYEFVGTTVQEVQACNYDEPCLSLGEECAEEWFDDSICEYESCKGCTDETALNYAPGSISCDDCCIYEPQECPLSPGHQHYCEDCDCYAGDGDCDSGQCLGGNTCSSDVGPNYGWSSTTDVCEGGADGPEPPIFWDGVSDFDATLEHTNGYLYVFKGNQYWKVSNTYFTISNNGFSPTYPRTIGSQGWQGIPGDLDAVVVDNDHVLFFKGSQYYKFANGAVLDGYPKQISSEWDGIPDNVDAVLNIDPEGNNAYPFIFIKGSECYRHSGESGSVYSQSPQSISWCFPGVPEGIDAASNTGFLVFFKDNNYWVWSNSNDVWSVEAGQIISG